MAQFDVYPNPQIQARDRYPFVVNIQSALLDGLPSRLVIPLSSVGMQASSLPKRLVIEANILGRKLTLMPQLAAPVPTDRLSKPVANIAAMQFDIVSALDAVISGI